MAQLTVPEYAVQTGMGIFDVPDVDIIGSRCDPDNGKNKKIHPQSLSPPAAVLAQMYEIILETIPDKWMAFRALIHILGDAVRIHSLEKDLYPIADKVVPLFHPFVAALKKEELPFDAIGEVFTHFKVSDGGGGQVLTPRWICEYINDNTVGKGMQEIVSEDRDTNRPITALDPAAGTGRFPIDLAQRYGVGKGDHPLVIYAVEKNIWLYRACLVNMRLLAPLQPVQCLWADALITDIGLDSLNWIVANRWYPIDWRELIPMPADPDKHLPNLNDFSLKCGGPEPDPGEYVSLQAYEARYGPLISTSKNACRDGQEQTTGIEVIA